MSESLSWKLQAPLRWLTGPWRMLPDFIVAGVQKGGTTSLYSYLIQHPAVLPANIKEPHFFDKKFRYGVSWYRGQFPSKYKYKSLSKRVGEWPLSGEATPYYLFHPLAAKRIAANLPECKTIILLRNPIERAYSHYQHEVRAGRETLSFEQAIEQEPVRLAGEEERLRNEPNYHSYNHRKFSYVSRGYYAEQLERWWQHIDKNRTFVAASEDFFHSPENVYAEVLDYLGLSNWQPPSFQKFNSHPYNEIASETRSYLASHFSAHNERLYEMLGRDFHWT